MVTQVGRPWSAQIELTEGCTRLCGYCGLNAIREGKGDYKRMTIALAELVASQMAELNPEARLEFAMHGEPTVNPDGPAIIARFRAAMPKAQIMLTTNGATFMDPKTVSTRVAKWFGHGVDFIVCDTYYPERDELQASLRSIDPKVCSVKDFYADLAPTGWNPYHNHHGKTGRLLVIMDDIGARDREHSSRTLLNHAGSNPMMDVPAEPLKKTCTNPFREVTVTWNGEVRICCMSWLPEYVCGVVSHKRSLSSIWYGEEFELARKMLQNKNRDFAPCRYCNKDSGSRSGLLPKYSPLTEADIARAQEIGKPRMAERIATGAPMSDALKRRLKVIP